MPTAAQYHAAADGFEGFSTAIVGEYGQFASTWSTALLSTGNIATKITELVDAAGSDVATISSISRQLSNECRRRAYVCEQYDYDLSKYRSDLRRKQLGGPGADQLSPTKPSKEASWVEES